MRKSSEKLNRRILLTLILGSITIIVTSSLIIYENGVLNPTKLSGSWQRPLENFATGLVSDNDKVYVLDISGNIEAFSIKNGSSLWKSNANSGYFSSGLVSSADKVYGGGEVASVGCIDKSTGNFLWSFDGEIRTDLWDKKAPDEIIVSGDVVSSIDGGVNVRNANTGAFLWQASRPEDIEVAFGNMTDLTNWWVDAYPLGGNPFEGNFVYALAGNYSNPYVSKFNFKNANFVWSSNITLTAHPIGYPEGYPGYSGNSVSVIATYKGQVIIQNSNRLLSFNDTSGDLLWSRDIGATIYQPTSNAELLYFGASNGNFYAINLTDGTIAWKTRVDTQSIMSTVNNDNITLTTYPVQVQNNKVYWSFGITQQLGTSSADKHDHYLGTACSLDSANGEVVWSRQIQDNGVFYGFSADLALNNNEVFLNENNALWVFVASNGNLVSNQQFDHYVLPPIASGNVVFVASDLQLTAYK